MKRSSILYVLLLIITSIFAVRALLHEGFFTSHDGWHQVARLYHFDQLIRSGQFPPRYSFDLLYGYGYPLFTFSYHLPWFIAEILMVFGLSIFDSIKGVFLLGYIISGITMFSWQKSLWGDRGAFVASFLYLWAPYRFSNIFVRASLGEATSFIFLPLVFYSIQVLSEKKDSSAIFWGAIGLVGLILSHSMIFFFLAVPIFVYSFTLFYLSPQKKFFLFQALLMIIVGFLLSAYYTIPAVIFKNLTIFTTIQQLFFQQQFPSFSELLYSPWGYATAHSGPGQMSFQVGIGQWISFISALLLISWYKVNNQLGNMKQKSLIVSVFILIFIFGIFSMLPISKPLWQALGKSIPIDFPWRFLGIVVLASAVLSGFVTSAVEKKSGTVITIFLILCVLYTNKNHLRVNEYTFIPLSLYVASERTTNTYDEYLPRWARSEEVMKEKRQPITIPDTVHVTDLFQSAGHLSYVYISERGVPTTIRIIYFPGLKLLVDSKMTPFDYQSNGFINFLAPSGRHTVELLFAETGLGQTSIVLSLFGIVTICFLLMKRILILGRRI